MNRRHFKRYLLTYKTKVLREGPGHSAIFFENGRKSSFDKWVLDVAPLSFTVVRLDKSLFFLVRHTDEFFARRSYKTFFFHSPGEALQAKFISDCSRMNIPTVCIGFQHGFIGTTPPKGFDSVISHASVKKYISFEKGFTQAAQKKLKGNVVQIAELSHSLTAEPLTADRVTIFFDAPDQPGFYKNLWAAYKFKRANPTTEIELRFHPITNGLLTLAGKLLLTQKAEHSDNPGTSAAICWKSKIKFELSHIGDVFTLDDTGKPFRMILGSKGPEQVLTDYLSKYI